MTTAEAYATLTALRPHVFSLYAFASISPYVMCHIADLPDLTMDGVFTPAQIEALLVWMADPMGVMREGNAV